MRIEFRFNDGKSQWYNVGLPLPWVLHMPQIGDYLTFHPITGESIQFELTGAHNRPVYVEMG